MNYDLLIKNGTVIDPSQDLNDIRDVALLDGKISEVRKDIAENGCKEILDATGLIVSPGLLDLHVHVYWGASHYGIEPDTSNVAKGVTTAVDAGSAGAGTFPAFRKYVLQRAETRLFALLNISAMGMISHKIGESEDLRWADVESAVEMGRANREYVIGIKARLSENLVGSNDLECLKRAIEAAEALNGIVMIHIGETNTPLEKLISMLRPGDVVTHIFHGRSHGVLDDAGRVIDGVRDAQERGIILDIGHGAGSFSFDVAEKAISQGLFPGNISSDLHVYNIDGPVYDQMTTLSKFIHLGMEINEVLRLSSQTTAKIIGLSDSIGTLKPGAEGDVTIMRLEEGRFVLTDSTGTSVNARQKLNHIWTVRNGKLYRK